MSREPTAPHGKPTTRLGCEEPTSCRLEIAGDPRPTAEVVVRTAEASDRAALCRLRQAAIEAAAPAHYTEEQIDLWLSLDPWAKGNEGAAVPGEKTLVASRASEPIGAAMLRGSELVALYVHPKWTGRGVGSVLLRDVEKLGRESGVRVLRVNSALNASAFYRSRSYRVVERRCSCFCHRSGDRWVELTTLLMTKVL